ncbi:hypothetical protein ES288_A08G147500v1 [Gossypium darwinii]|uniref:Protein TILLER ANGLE CONTROL 1 n=1 Tax=Gossypium darwinii TaxID=34276 RepID=A0A5D2FLJ8_GOSDA|nr:hypothetical protein ES288_A08G147500v1 [Gossypium darwinii]
MKIFNWLHKRFPHNVLKDGLVRNVKKTDSIAIDTNSKALLEQVALFDLLDGWRYGVLTIGTFGFDPLKSLGELNDHLPLESNGDEEEEERFSNNNDEDDDDDNNNSYDEVNPLVLGHSLEDILEDSTHNEIKFNLEVIEDHSEKLRRRTTLADLFYQDSDMKNKPTHLDLELNPCEKASFPTKKGTSFAKKFIPHAGKDSRPIKMLNQMMNRMLKRKIHPELQGKGNKLEGQCKP